MSPRSDEFLAQGRDRAAAAAELLRADHLEAAVSAAYYSMLYGARAALSEDAPAVGAAILPFSHFLLPKPGALWKAPTGGVTEDTA